MLSEVEIINKLKTLLSKDRFEHTLRVKDTAIKLAKYYNCDIEKTRIAALLHDCAKDYNLEESLELCEKYNIELDDITKKRHQLIHPILSAKLAQVEFGVEDKDIINAIKYHTTGRQNMSMLEKIIWLADYIEPNRDFDRIEEVRKLAYEDIDKAILLAFELSVEYIKLQKKKLHPRTLDAITSVKKYIN